MQRSTTFARDLSKLAEHCTHFGYCFQSSGVLPGCGSSGWWSSHDEAEDGAEASLLRLDREAERPRGGDRVTPQVAADDALLDRVEETHDEIDRRDWGADVFQEHEATIGAADADQLAQRCFRIGDGTEGQTDRDGVETAVGEWQPLGICQDQQHRPFQLRDPASRLGEHPAREVESHATLDVAGIVRQIETAANPNLQGVAPQGGAKGRAQRSYGEPLPNPDGPVVPLGLAVVIA